MILNAAKFAKTKGVWSVLLGCLRWNLVPDFWSNSPSVTSFLIGLCVEISRIAGNDVLIYLTICIYLSNAVTISLDIWEHHFRQSGIFRQPEKIEMLPILTTCVGDRVGWHIFMFSHIVKISNGRGQSSSLILTILSTIWESGFNFHSSYRI